MSPTVFSKAEKVLQNLNVKKNLINLLIILATNFIGKHICGGIISIFYFFIKRLLKGDGGEITVGDCLREGPRQASRVPSRQAALAKCFGYYFLKCKKWTKFYIFHKEH